MRHQSVFHIGLSASLSILSLASYAALPINSVQDGRIIHGGTYGNTADHVTTFTNSGPGGLWLKVGETVHGQEVDSAGNSTNNGGALHLYAPGQVVRIDGTIDVNAAINGQGAALGNGGKVYIDSAYLFQNGNILANGLNGGLVQANVGSMTISPGAQIQAKGLGGNGGVVAINASGPVDIRRAALIDTSGRVTGSFDTNLINIEGSVVNVDGVLRADGVQAQYGGSRGGTIRLVADGQTDALGVWKTLTNATVSPDHSEPIISAAERVALLQRSNYLSSAATDGNVQIGNAGAQAGEQYGSIVSASGTQLIYDHVHSTHIGGKADPNEYTPPFRGDYVASNRSGDGGTIIVNAMNQVINQGHIRANGGAGNFETPEQKAVDGGQGGTVAVLALQGIKNQGLIEANGATGGSSGTYAGGGGSGGLLAFSYGASPYGQGDFVNSGIIRANGGNGGGYWGSTKYQTGGMGGKGGLVVLSGTNNPSGDGLIEANGASSGATISSGPSLFGGAAGTIVSPNPVDLGRTQILSQKSGSGRYNPITEQTETNELLTHGENLILLSRRGGSTPSDENLFARLLQAKSRSVELPTETAIGAPMQEIVDKNTSTSRYVYRNLVIGSTRDNLALDLSHPWRSGAFEPSLILPSSLSNGQAFTTLNTLSIMNNGAVRTQVFRRSDDQGGIQPMDFWLVGRNNNSLGGGRISVLANGNITNTNIFGTQGVASGGSVNLATNGVNANTGNYIGAGTLETVGGLHGGSIMVKARFNINQNQVQSFDGVNITANGSLMGGTIRLLPQILDFNYLRTDAATTISANGGLQGGVIDINAGFRSLMNPPSPTGEPPMISAQSITANGTLSTEGRGGYISVHTTGDNVQNITVEANGAAQNGTVSFTTGN